MMKSLGEQKCGSCRFTDECTEDRRQRINTALNTGRIARCTRIYIGEIKDKLPTIRDVRVKARLMAAIQQLEANEDYENSLYHDIEGDEWLQSHLMPNWTTPVTEFTVKGTTPRPSGPDQDCRVCYEHDQEYTSLDGRIQACEECARIWTEETQSTEWLQFTPKNC